VADPILTAEQLTKLFPVRRVLFGKARRSVRAVEGVSFEVRRREVLGLVGESGCGKSTTGRLVLRLLEPSSGRVVFDGTDITALRPAELRSLRRRFQIIFQDPYSALNPRMTIGRIVAEPLLIHRACPLAEIADRVAEMLAKVGLASAHMRRYPHELSGGQRQRVGIARALIVNPQLVVADEPVSALDVSIQAQVLNLLQDLKDEFQLSLLMISHNIAAIQHACDRVAVMYLGQIVEMGETDEIVMSPRHPYTMALVSAVPVPDPAARRKRILLKGDVPSPIDPPGGCRFHTRCRHARPECAAEPPVLRELSPGHLVACHFAEQIAAQYTY
jgi:oligopeptide transport system ATP-binding protein